LQAKVEIKCTRRNLKCAPKQQFQTFYRYAHAAGNCGSGHRVVDMGFHDANGGREFWFTVFKQTQ
jgi:hypothetical protein